jgi:hypothetical protein
MYRTTLLYRYVIPGVGIKEKRECCTHIDEAFEVGADFVGIRDIGGAVHMFTGDNLVSVVTEKYHAD